MSKKPQVPHPRRGYERSDTSTHLNRRTGLIVVGALLGLAVVGSAALVLRGGGDGAALPTTSSECPTRQFAEQDATHVEELPAGYEYNSDPPTSGVHHPVPAVWGSYADEIPKLTLVHNLEHGGVVVQYGRSIAPDVRAQIEDWYREDPNGIVVASLPELEGQVIATAWTWRMTCAGFDEGALSQFRDEHRAQGPERFPLDSLLPGT